jgi:hypothetical protein
LGGAAIAFGGGASFFGGAAGAGAGGGAAAGAATLAATGAGGAATRFTRYEGGIGFRGAGCADRSAVAKSAWSTNEAAIAHAIDGGRLVARVRPVTA